MKRFLLIALVICLSIALVGCGGSSTPASQDNSKPAAEGNKEPAKDNSSEPAKEPVKEMTVNTGIGKEGGEVTVQTGEGMAWDQDKMGGLPKPEGVNVVMAMDMSKILGKSYAHSYTVTGFKKENYNKYVEVVGKQFPKLINNSFSETEAVYMASSADGEENILIAWNGEGEESVIQYFK